jgi:short-subunit dehydrogenase
VQRFAEAAALHPSDAEAAMPKIMWVPSGRVAEQAVAALDAGRPVVIPGVANRLSAWAASATPRRVLLPVLRRRHPALRTQRR